MDPLNFEHRIADCVASDLGGSFGVLWVVNKPAWLRVGMYVCVFLFALRCVISSSSQSVSPLPAMDAGEVGV